MFQAVLYNADGTYLETVPAETFDAGAQLLLSTIAGDVRYRPLTVETQKVGNYPRLVLLKKETVVGVVEDRIPAGEPEEAVVGACNRLWDNGDGTALAALFQRAQ